MKNCSITPQVIRNHSDYMWLYVTICDYDRRKFRSQTSDNMDRWKAEQGRGREKRKIRRKKIRRERVRRKKMHMREKGRKVGKSRNTVFFQWFVAPEGRKVGSLKRGCGASWPHERWKIARRCGAKHISKSKCTKHTIVGPLLKLQCRKSARRCGAKHISKSKCTKHTRSGPLLEVEMSKKCTPCGAKHISKWKCTKHHMFAHFWRFGCWKSARRCGAKHISKSKCTKHQGFAPLLEVQMLKKCTPLWREAGFEVKMYKTLGIRTTFGGSDVASLQDTTLQDITLHYTPVHYIHPSTLHYTKLHYTTLHYTEWLGEIDRQIDW